MDELIKTLLPQAPYVVMLLYGIKTLYIDAKSERATMRAQIDLLTAKIGALEIAITHLADNVGVVPKVKLTDDGELIRS